MCKQSYLSKQIHPLQNSFRRLHQLKDRIELKLGIFTIFSETCLRMRRSKVWLRFGQQVWVDSQNQVIICAWNGATIAVAGGYVEIAIRSKANCPQPAVIPRKEGVETGYLFAVKTDHIERGAAQPSEIELTIQVLHIPRSPGDAAAR